MVAAQTHRMHSRPAHLPDDAAVADALRARWGTGRDTEPAELRYRALGFGSYHWEVADPGGRSWFATLDDLTMRPHAPGDSCDATYARLRAALATARAAYEAGASYVVAPVRCADGDVVTRLSERYALALYPYVYGRPRAYDDELSPADREAVLGLVAALHGSPSPVRAEANVEDYLIPGRDVLVAALADLGGRWDGGPYAERTRVLLGRAADEVEQLLDRRDALAARARERPDRMVLTHGEPHAGNLIETDAGWRLVDWDTVLVAPPERDLWMLDPGDGSAVAAYERATGRPVLPAVLELYRLTWRLADIASFVGWFRAPHDDTEDTRKAWQGLTWYLTG